MVQTLQRRLDSGDPTVAARRLSRCTRRRFIHVTIAGIAIAPLLSACGGQPAAPTAAPTKPAAAPTTAPAAPTAALAAKPPEKPAEGKPAAQVGPGGFSGGGELQILLNAHFIPAYDTWVDQWAADWGEKNRVKITIDHILAGQTAQKNAAEVAAGTGHDMIRFTRGGEVNLFNESLVDVSDLAKQIGQQYGGWVLPISEQIGMHEGVWKGLPEYFVDRPALYRKDLFDANGLKVPETWEDLLKAGAVLKGKGNPVGIAISQGNNDSHNSLVSILWSYGASYVGPDSKTVTVDTPEMRQAISYVVELYKQAMTDEVLSWDESSNNQALASGRASWIHNPISALRTIEKSSPELAKNIFISLPPGGPKGRQTSVSTNVFGIMSWSKNVPAAKAFLTDYFALYSEAVKVSEGYNQPLLNGFRKKPMPILGDDPKLQVLQDFDQLARTSGNPGSPTPASGEVDNNWIVPLMIGKAVQDSDVDAAIRWGEEKVKVIYDKYK
jgi:multiple sugar transport system substrate-binding protein